MPSVLYLASSFTDGLQILYLQACNLLYRNGISADNLQMADKMRKKLLCRVVIVQTNEI